MQLTTYETSVKFDLSTGYLRQLILKNLIKARKAQITSKSHVWLIEIDSLQSFLKQVRKPGRPSKKKTSL